MLTFSTDGKALINSSELTTIYLYEVYYDDAQDPKRFADWDDDVLFGGNTYEKAVIKASEQSCESDGQISDVTLTVGNADRAIQYYIENYDLIGKKVKIIQIFSGVSDYIATTFRIKSAKAKKDYVSFTLSIGFDVLRLEIPARTVRSRMCWHRFKGTDGSCGYSGSDTTCDRSFEACKAKGNVARFGGFPAIPNERIYF
jgi:phage-related protein